MISRTSNRQPITLLAVSACVFVDNHIVFITHDKRNRYTCGCKISRFARIDFCSSFLTWYRNQLKEYEMKTINSIDKMNRHPDSNHSLETLDRGPRGRIPRWLWHDTSINRWKTVPQEDNDKIEREYQSYLKHKQRGSLVFHCFGDGITTIIDYRTMKTECGSGRCLMSHDSNGFQENHNEFALLRTVLPYLRKIVMWTCPHSF